MQINDKFLRVTESDRESILEALSNLKLSGTSKTVGNYEKALANFFSAKYAIAISSGTAAIHACLVALGISDDDEILLPATAPIMTGFPIIFQRAKPVFVDTNGKNFGFDIQDLKRKVTSKTKAIICVPMWGYPFDYKDLLQFSKNYGVSLIEDAAEAHNTEYNGKKIGSLGDFGCFSTHDRKLLATGEGGFILTNNPKYYKKIKSFINYSGMDGKAIGTNYKLSTLQAAIGLSRIKQMDWQVKMRRQNAMKILSGINSNKVSELPFPVSSKLNYQSLLLNFNLPSKKTARIISKLFKMGIPSDVVKYDYKPMYHYPIFRKWAIGCPNTEKLVKSFTTIPVHPGIDDKAIEYIIKSINLIVKDYD
ncbi:MAG: DegT/DnrJ/EryC1/StrS family aminotransferase [Candidatus Nealsonbacteria bacterium]